MRKPQIGYNPWIALLKAWICALCDNPRIVRSIRGSRNEGAKYGSSQTMDLRSLESPMHKSKRYTFHFRAVVSACAHALL